MPFPRPRARRAALLALVAAWTGALACGGNVIVDDAAPSGGSGGATTGSTTATTGTVTGTMTTPQTPDAGNTACNQEYTTVIGELESALGCTPTANEPQCTGAALLHDPCGCVFVANEAHPDIINSANNAWMGCVSDGCCGAGTAGCAPCPPPPTTGFCDVTTSQCLPGP